MLRKSSRARGTLRGSTCVWWSGKAVLLFMQGTEPWSKVSLAEGTEVQRPWGRTVWRVKNSREAGTGWGRG